MSIAPEFVPQKEYAEDDDDDLSDSDTESTPEDDDQSHDDGVDDIELGNLTENQRRLLYMVSCYTKPSVLDMDKSEWIRREALVVLIYEGIVGGDPAARKATVLEYDYAPSSQIVEGRRVWLNLPHEGLSDLEFLCEENFLHILKMASTHHSSITAYQVTDKGQQIVDRMSRVDKVPVNELVYAPGTRNLLSVKWFMDDTVTDGTGGAFILKDMTLEDGYEYVSTITECEDVSYVSSAYIPLCLRQGGRPTLSNAHRAHESAAGQSEIKDVLDEVITLNSVSIIVSEFIPFGANNMVTTNYNLGSQERVQGGLFTPAMGGEQIATKMYIKPGMTKVDILDYSMSSHVNFEAEINEPESKGIVQIEQFGISLNSSGACFYGMQIEAVQDRIRDGISLDQLSRLLVDVQSDSSVVVDTIVTKHQLDLQKLIFRDDEENRSKVKLVVANEMVPHLLAEEYMDRGDYENELRQVIGETKTAYDISEHDVLIFGDEGLMLVGPNSRHHEPLLCSFIEVLNVDVYTRAFYQRLFLELDAIRSLKDTVFKADKDPNTVPKTRERMARISVNLTMLEEVLGYMAEALAAVSVPPEPPEATGRQLYARLSIPETKRELQTRVSDLTKIMRGATQEFQVLKEVTSSAQDEKWYRLNEQIESNTKAMCVLQEANQRSADSLRLLQITLGGLLAFGILDRITGEWGTLDVNAPFLWFLLNVLLWIGVASLLLLLLRRYSHLSSGNVLVRLKVNQPILLDNLQRFVSLKNVEDESHRLVDGNHTVKVVWRESHAGNWGGFAPKIEVEFDDATSFMLAVTISYNRRQAKKYFAYNSEELTLQLFEEMQRHKVFANPKYMPSSAIEPFHAATENLKTLRPAVRFGIKTSPRKGHT